VIDLQVFLEAEKKRLDLIKTFKPRISSGEKLRVVFLGYALGGASDIFSGMYRQFAEDDRFECSVVIVPNSYGTEKQMLAIIESAIAFLNDEGIPYINGYDENTKEFYDAENQIDPDIVFMAHPYEWFDKEFRIDNFLNKVVYMFSYGIRLVSPIYLRSNVLAHEMFYETKELAKLQSKQAYSVTGNIEKRFLGHPKFDGLLFPAKVPHSIWPIADRNVKRIIWAPHHTDFWATNFIEQKDFFLNLAKNNSKIQIVFRPHPGLSGSLVRNNGWTEGDVERYYEKWRKMQNGAVSDVDDFHDLFRTSDAMIFDSLSFMAEYQLVNKPSLYLNKPGKPIPVNGFGEKVREHIYHAYNTEDIIRFIEDVVIDGKDPKEKGRRKFVKQHFFPPHKKTAAENYYNYILKDIGIGKKKVKAIN